LLAISRCFSALIAANPRRELPPLELPLLLLGMGILHILNNARSNVETKREFTLFT